ncbi:hypothetical protein O988_03860 [Pseudogymnoascus sp. VKM F-3808]|nr:hypothetical protein O988_03860 [Pseudogymnoascus sp. VKM F-3808]
MLSCQHQAPDEAVPDNLVCLQYGGSLLIDLVVCRAAPANNGQRSGHWQKVLKQRLQLRLDNGKGLERHESSRVTIEILGLHTTTRQVDRTGPVGSTSTSSTRTCMHDSHVNGWLTASTKSWSYASQRRGLLQRDTDGAVELDSLTPPSHVLPSILPLKHMVVGWKMWCSGNEGCDGGVLGVLGVVMGDQRPTVAENWEASDSIGDLGCFGKKGWWWAVGERDRDGGGGGGGGMNMHGLEPPSTISQIEAQHKTVIQVSVRMLIIPSPIAPFSQHEPRQLPLQRDKDHRTTATATPSTHRRINETNYQFRWGGGKGIRGLLCVRITRDAKGSPETSVLAEPEPYFPALPARVVVGVFLEGKKGDVRDNDQNDSIMAQFDCFQSSATYPISNHNRKFKSPQSCKPYAPQVTIYPIVLDYIPDNPHAPSHNKPTHPSPSIPRPRHPPCSMLHAAAKNTSWAGGDGKWGR